MKKMAKGFTLIELIVVIVILGILAAFALPRFASLDSEARQSTLEALTGSLRSSSTMAYAKALASNSYTSIVMDNKTIALSGRYPTSATIGDTIADTSGFSSVLLSGDKIFWPKGLSGTNSATCRVTYRAPSTSTSQPTISLIKTDCS